MGFADILGQDTAVGTLRRALLSGRVHHAYRFEGPPGVGKEMAAMALARALVCERPGAGREACGACGACARAAALSPERPRVPLHPDVVLVERDLYPPESLGRSSPEAATISVDQVRKVVLGRLAFPPYEGRARVFVVRRADELSPSAANALLKTLEEPPPGTHFVLVTSRGPDLLPTIRSRTLRVRFAPLPDAVVLGILAARGVPAEAARGATALAGGSASLAIELADAEASRDREAFVDAALRAVGAPGLGAAIALSDARDRDRDALGERLDALASRLAGLGADAARRGDEAAAATAAGRHEVVLRASRELESMGSPALVIEAMVVRMRAAG